MIHHSVRALSSVVTRPQGSYRSAPITSERETEVPPISDAEIRVRLRRSLSKHGSSSSRIVDEFVVANGAGRVDMLVLDTDLHGYEIKSDRDSLRRLPAQIRIFGEVLDRITLVVGWTHAAAAMRVVPEWWAVSLAERGTRGAIRFTRLREGDVNPIQNAHSLVRLLWKDELIELLHELGAPRFRQSNRRLLRSELVSLTPSYSWLRSEVCARLTRRPDRVAASQSV